MVPCVGVDDVGSGGGVLHVEQGYVSVVVISEGCGLPRGAGDRGDPVRVCGVAQRQLHLCSDDNYICA